MKRQILLGLLFLATVFAMAQGSKKETLTVKTQIFCSHCLQCGSCGKNINDHIREQNTGISKVSVDQKENTITVVYDPAKTDANKIRAAINSAGFDADDKKAPAQAVNALDGCCKKQ